LKCLRISSRRYFTHTNTHVLQQTFWSQYGVFLVAVLGLSRPQLMCKTHFFFFCMSYNTQIRHKTVQEETGNVEKSLCYLKCSLIFFWMWFSVFCVPDVTEWDCQTPEDNSRASSAKSDEATVMFGPWLYTVHIRENVASVILDRPVDEPKVKMESDNAKLRIFFVLK
jgi:hypothetical protein